MRWSQDEMQRLVQLFYVYKTAFHLYPEFPGRTVSQIRSKVYNMKRLIKEENKRNQMLQDDSHAIKVTPVVQSKDLPTIVPTTTPPIVEVFRDQTQIFQRLSTSESNEDSSEIQIIAKNDQKSNVSISSLFDADTLSWDVFGE
ncbi:SANT/Myb_domain [Hexamita inflata]|uniref:SANT/Myb domain n=1 Tax=Hexamita inflata TaxID=28002 RepID=A0AA86Q7N7_9EUKA|nr:SANT/Myb domain [Hexamita inflata]